MPYPLPLSEDHKILEHEFCSGYIDTFGKWNTGFYCPQIESTTAVYCCGTPTFKYCCTIRQGGDDDGGRGAILEGDSSSFFFRTPIIVGIIAGVTLVLVLTTVASCFFCSCCLVYKKRRAQLTGGLYRMQCPSTQTSNLISSPASTSNQASLATTPLDLDYSHITDPLVMAHHHQLQHYHQQQNDSQLLTIQSGINGYPASSLSPPYTPSHLQASNHLLQQPSNNVQHLPAPHYQNSPDGLPPPVFYPENHFRHSGTPYSMTSSTSSYAASSTPRPHGQYQPSFTLSTIARSPQYQAQPPPPPPSILRNSFSRAVNGTLPIHNHTYQNTSNINNCQQQQQPRRNSEYMLLNGGVGGQVPSFSTLPRRTPGYQLTPHAAGTLNRNGRASADSGRTTPSIREGLLPGPAAEGHVERLLVNGTPIVSQSNMNHHHRLATCLSDDEDLPDTLSSSAL